MLLVKEYYSSFVSYYTKVKVDRNIIVYACVAHMFSDDREHESEIMGKDTWGTFGHASEAEFDEDIGIFHPSVTPSPTVITLCGNVAVKKPPKITCHPLPDAFNPCKYINSMCVYSNILLL